MDAIVSGKVEKPKGSLGVFKSIRKYTVAHANVDYFNLDSVIPDKPDYPNPLTTQYYLKVNSANDTSFIINLMNCNFLEAGVTNSLSSENRYQLYLSSLKNDAPWFGTKINFGYNTANNYLIFTMSYYDMYLSDYIASFEIGTLE